MNSTIEKLKPINHKPKQNRNSSFFSFFIQKDIPSVPLFPEIYIPKTVKEEDKNKPLTTSEIEEYKSIVKFFADNDVPKIFSNSGAKLSSIVLSEIFNKCTSSIRMYLQNLSGDIIFQSADAFAHLELFLRKGGILRIVTDSQTEDSSLYQKLSKLNSENKLDIVFKQSTPKFEDCLFSEGLAKVKFKYFTVGDSSMFRLELDPTEHTAKCSFNNPSIGKIISQRFDEAFDFAKPAFQ